MIDKPKPQSAAAPPDGSDRVPDVSKAYLEIPPVDTEYDLDVVLAKLEDEAMRRTIKTQDHIDIPLPAPADDTPTMGKESQYIVHEYTGDSAVQPFKLASEGQPEVIGKVVSGHPDDSCGDIDDGRPDNQEASIQPSERPPAASLDILPLPDAVIKPPETGPGSRFPPRKASRAPGLVLGVGVPKKATKAPPGAAKTFRKATKTSTKVSGSVPETAGTLPETSRGVPGAAKTPRPASRSAIEADLKARYPVAAMVSGSYRAPGAVDAFGAKATVEIVCADCQKKRRIATSDLWQVRRCVKCAAVHSKAARKADKQMGKKASGN